MPAVEDDALPALVRWAHHDLAYHDAATTPIPVASAGAFISVRVDALRSGKGKLERLKV